jgi:hypothetical protein
MGQDTPPEERAMADTKFTPTDMVIFANAYSHHISCALANVTYHLSADIASIVRHYTFSTDAPCAAIARLTGISFKTVTNSPLGSWEMKFEMKSRYAGQIDVGYEHAGQSFTISIHDYAIGDVYSIFIEHADALPLMDNLIDKMIPEYMKMTKNTQIRIFANRAAAALTRHIESMCHYIATGHCDWGTSMGQLKT